MCIEEFVTEALGGFVRDPADSDFQRGFLAALIQVAEEIMLDEQSSLLAGEINFKKLKEQLRG